MLKSLDIFSFPISLNYNNNFSYHTKLGGIVSLIIIIIIFMCIFYFSSTLFLGIDPNISVRNTNFKNYPERIINNDNFFIAFRIENEGVNIEIRNDSLNIAAYYVKMSNFSTKNYDTYPIVRCDKLWNSDNKFAKMFSNKDLSTLYCVNFTDSYIYGFYNQKEFNYLTIEFGVCKNSTSVICKDKNFIYNMYQLKTIHFYLYNNEINTNSIDQPITNNYYSVYNKFDFKMFKEMEVYYKNVTVSSDEGLISPSIKNMTDIIFDNSDKLFGLRDESLTDNIFYYLNIFLKRNYIVYNRTYKRVYEVFASLSGIIQSLRLIGKLLICSFTQKIFDLDLCNKFYKFNMDNEIREEKNVIRIHNSFNQKTNRKDDSMRINLAIDETILKSTEIDNKILKYLDVINKSKIKKKINYSNNDLFISVLNCKKFYENGLLIKEKFYRYSIDKINSYLDISNIIKTSKEFSLIKEILLTKEQNLAIKYIDRSELIKNDIDKKDTSEEDILRVVMRYLLKNKSVNKFKKVDYNIIEWVDAELKKLIFE